MQYIPPGFWPRLTTRILDDENLCSIFSKIFYVSKTMCAKNCENSNKSSLITPNILNMLNEILNRFGGQFFTNINENNVNKNTEVETSFIILQNKFESSEQINKSSSNFFISSVENDNQLQTKFGFEWLLWQTGFEVVNIRNNLK